MSHQSLDDLDGELPAPTLDMHRALAALGAKVAELDQLNQRWELCTDPELRLLLGSLRNTTRQQIAMLLEWTRRRDTALDKEMKAALFKAGPIAAQFHYE
ncbi:hypothetical protein ACFOLJ_19630 [Rugamonas sp. CCM 8940]|uniref:ferritin family protein n=1 Tax=Rugamonas sp. CCM 8940 TaxID=2765359 RepID=UPI0018F493EE|nr:hypothetical protein [Rugamonas sp. CCM 8940]MBJ7312318.1 hypothetical protein [Rugamonas sp. CCM 8940]